MLLPWRGCRWCAHYIPDLSFRRGREVLDDTLFGQLLGCLMEYQTDVVTVSQLIIRVQAICRTAHPELFREFCEFLPRDYRSAVVLDTEN